MKVCIYLKNSFSKRKLFNQSCFYSFSSRQDSSKNLYKILEINNNATQEEIKKAYYNLAKKYHPDVNKGTEAHFKEINMAYEILSNESERRKYDQNLSGDSFQKKYSQGSQNAYSSYHYGYTVNPRNTYRRANEYYEFRQSDEKSDEFFYRTANNFNKRRPRKQFDEQNYYHYSFYKSRTRKSDFDVDKDEYVFIF